MRSQFSARRSIIGVLGVCLLDEDEGVRVDEPADVVNVAVGIIARGTGDEPLDIADPEGFLEGLLKLRAAHPGIAHLDLGVEVTLLSGEHGAASIDVDAAAFKDERMAVTTGIEQGDIQEFGGHLGHAAVPVPIVVLGPGIKMEIDDGRSGPGASTLAPRGRLADKNRAAIAHPTPVGRMDDELDLFQVGSRPSQVTVDDLLVGSALDQDSNRLAGGESADDFSINPANGIELVGPIGRIVGPAEPSGLMGLPLGGHGVAQFGGGLSSRGTLYISHKHSNGR